MNLDEFASYYNVVSMCVDEDRKFEEYMTGVWSIDRLAYQKKKHVEPRKEQVESGSPAPAHAK